MATQPEPITTAAEEPEEHPRFSLVKEPPPAPGETERDDEPEDAEPVGGVRAELGAIIGREAWAEFGEETGELIRAIAARFAGVPARAGRALWRGTVSFVIRIKDGSVFLAGRLIEWVTAPEPKAKKAEWPRPVRRGLVVLFSVYAIYHEGRDAPETVAAVTLTGWWAVALIASRHVDKTAEPAKPAEPADQTADTDEPEEETATRNDHEKSGETGENPTPEQAAARLAVFVEQAVAAADHIDGHKGVHTETLLAAINRTEGLRAAVLDPLDQGDANWDVARLNATLTGLGIPVHNKGFKLILNGKQRTRAGVRHDQLTKTLGRRPRIPPQMVADRTPQHPTN
ncbi:hypothetical protein [Streptomyces sp. NPDC058247]|uniref:hypothetical protein n=1 Tax=Streptomyces sp. NPDC058247 TaxID=3346401 RepID=UPI0036ED891B